MTENKRNVMVGLMVIAALGILGTLILIFTGLPQMFMRGNIVKIHFNNTHGLISGDTIHLLDKDIGRVTDVRFTDGDPRRGVTVTARIDSGIRLPSNVQASVSSRGITGKGYLSLWPSGPLRKNPDTGEEMQFYPKDMVIELVGVPQTGGGMFPPELTTAMKDFGKLATNLNKLLEGGTTETPGSTTKPTATTAPASRGGANGANGGNIPSPGLLGTITRLNRTLDAVYQVAGNSENQANMKKTLKNLADASDDLKVFMKSANKTLTHADELTRQLITDAGEIGSLITTFRKAAEKMNDGKGTVGKMLNDPKLYNNLLEITTQLEELTKDFRRLADKWDKKGVGIKLK